jgi:hypothetical protein
VDPSSGQVKGDEIDRVSANHLGDMAAVFGASTDLFMFYYDETFDGPIGKNKVDVTCLDGSTYLYGLPGNVQQGSNDGHKQYFEITTPRVTQVARNIFNCQSMTGARIENQNTSPTEEGTDASCFGVGLDKRLFHDDALTSLVSKMQCVECTLDDVGVLQQVSLTCIFLSLSPVRRKFAVVQEKTHSLYTRSLGRQRMVQGRLPNGRSCLVWIERRLWLCRG